MVLPKANKKNKKIENEKTHMHLWLKLALLMLEPILQVDTELLHLYKRLPNKMSLIYLKKYTIVKHRDFDK